MHYILTTPATEKAVTVQELKDHLRVKHDFDDTYIGALGDAATKAVEDYTFIQLLPATWSLLLNDFPEIIEVEKVPLKSITSIKYYDENSDPQTVSDTIYTVEERTNPATIKLNPDESWPSTYATINAIEIEFISGYDTAADIPTPIIEAIKLIVGNLYEYRDDLQKKPDMTSASKVLLAPYVKPII